VLTFRGHHYPFRVSGMSFGATIGASTTDLVGRALNMHSPGDIAGNYGAIGAGSALAAGAGGVQLQNEKRRDPAAAWRQGWSRAFGCGGRRANRT